MIVDVANVVEGDQVTKKIGDVVLGSTKPVVNAEDKHDDLENSTEKPDQIIEDVSTHGELETEKNKESKNSGEVCMDQATPEDDEKEKQ